MAGSESECAPGAEPMEPTETRLRLMFAKMYADAVAARGAGKAPGPQAQPALLGATVSKEFPGHGTFMGTVRGYNSTLGYRVMYSDGDIEDCTPADVERMLGERLLRVERVCVRARVVFVSAR